jgi:glutaredoxin
MEFPIPDTSGFVVYGKTGCKFCDRVKTLLSQYEHEYKYINCDEYIVNRDAFREFMYGLTHTHPVTFPMVFLYGKFIGGYTETVQLMISSP